eukprot:CAMPEP_0197027534 /NCGR_PEP_ID=MMETSP1384-20130603/7432_1 /TAXON_ID=29189 /ORGANISM="Ammonia sp." /LENGTH=731 /DNA_ID=CAMNT_0042456395 /DNA_START=77 /DNA_END=2272 /DNA_ORIENTATION=+
MKKIPLNQIFTEVQTDKKQAVGASEEDLPFKPLSDSEFDGNVEEEKPAQPQMTHSVSYDVEEEEEENVDFFSDDNIAKKLPSEELPDTACCKCSKYCHIFIKWLKQRLPFILVTSVSLSVYVLLHYFLIADSDTELISLLICEFMSLWLLASCSFALCYQLVFTIISAAYSRNFVSQDMEFLVSFEDIKAWKRHVFLVLVTIFQFIAFIILMNQPRYERIDDFFDEFMQTIKRLLLCCVALSICLLLKAMCVRRIINITLKKNLRTVQSMKRYEKWFKLLVHKPQIFNIKLSTFLSIHTDPAEQDDEEDLDATTERNSLYLPFLKNQTLIKTTKIAAFDKLIYLIRYDAKTKQETFIADADLLKLCRVFARYIVKHIHTYTSTIKLDQKKILKNLAEKPDDSLSRSYNSRGHFSSRDHSNDFAMVDKEDFIACFTKGRNKKHPKYTMAVNAFRRMHVDRNNIAIDLPLQKAEITRFLYVYLRRLIYLKQTLISYVYLNSNLSAALTIFMIFIFCIICLLIFEFDFIQSISVFFSITALFALFGSSVFQQIFNGIAFVFVVAPYNIGDFILMDGARHIIKRINLITTVMVKASSNTTIIVYNSSLMGKNIENLTVTARSRLEFKVNVSQFASAESIDLLIKKVEKYVADSAELVDSAGLLTGVNEFYQMGITFYIGSFLSFSNSRIFDQRHNILMFIHKAIHELNIQPKRVIYTDSLRAITTQQSHGLDAVE